MNRHEECELCYKLNEVNNAELTDKDNLYIQHHNKYDAYKIKTTGTIVAEYVVNGCQLCGKVIIRNQLPITCNKHSLFKAFEHHEIVETQGTKVNEINVCYDCFIQRSKDREYSCKQCFELERGLQTPAFSYTLEGNPKYACIKHTIPRKVNKSKPYCTDCQEKATSFCPNNSQLALCRKHAKCDNKTIQCKTFDINGAITTIEVEICLHVKQTCCMNYLRQKYNKNNKELPYVYKDEYGTPNILCEECYLNRN